MSAKVFLKWFICLLALAGFLFQVFHISLVYFSFRSTTRTSILIPFTLAQHKTALCIRYRDVLNWSNLTKQTSARMTKVDRSFTAKAGLQGVMNDESKLTLKQIFDYTPKAEDIIDSCMFRPDDFDIEIHEKDYCTQKFRVNRYFTQEMICYNISEINDKPIRRRAATLSSFYSHRIYEIIFGKMFETANVVHVISYLEGDPIISREFAAINLDLFFQGVKRTNFLLYASSDYYVRSLEPPYETKCQHREWMERFDCYHECIMKKLSGKYSRAPTWEIFREHPRYYDLKPLSVLELRNKSLRAEVIQVNDWCYNRCLFTPCFYVFTKTATKVGRRSNAVLGIAYVTPNDPDTEITVVPVMVFIDFFTYICSCFGTWFGLSFMSFKGCRRMFLRKKKQILSRTQTWMTRLRM